MPKPKEVLHGFSPDELNAHSADVSVSPLDESVGVDEVLQEAADDGFKFRPVILAEVVLAISHFSSQARGEDEISQSVVVEAIPFVDDFLVEIFNFSMEQGIFPTAWKNAQLIALKKVSALSSPSDFWPIALLSFLSKALDELAHDQITKYRTGNGIFDFLQAGFRHFTV